VEQGKHCGGLMAIHSFKEERQAQIERGDPFTTFMECGENIYAFDVSA